MTLLSCLVGCELEQEPQLVKSPPMLSDDSEDAAADPRGRDGKKSDPGSIEKIEAEHLPNPVRVHERVISGGLPEGDAAFAELKKLGVRTVISVDGAKPDVATAEKYGMRYIHLPHGYDGVPEAKAKELAKAVRDLPGVIYIHCHHGKHRSPAAAAVACLGAGLIGHAEATFVLSVAGTGEGYRGLFQAVSEAQPLDAALLDSLQPEFPSVAKLPPMAEAMVAIEHIHDHLRTIEKAGWETPHDQPGLTTDHEALLLREHFTELLRTKELQEQPAAFQKLAKEAESAALALENSLRSSDFETENASRLFLAVSDNCKACHQAFRDVPLQKNE